LIEDTLDKLYEGATHIFIRTTEHKYLFANVAACFEQLNLSIQDARIITTESGLCMDTFIVLDANGEPIGKSPQRLKTIRAKLNKYLASQGQVIDNISRFIPRQLKHFNYPTHVTIITDTQKEQTIIEVITPDRPGLLALIGLIFADHQLMLQNAKISTLGERVEDVFFITDADDKAIYDADICQRMRSTSASARPKCQRSIVTMTRLRSATHYTNNATSGLARLSGDQSFNHRY
jgi:[protein-PII] uridylyltransferase